MKNTRLFTAAICFAGSTMLITAQTDTAKESAADAKPKTAYSAGLLAPAKANAKAPDTFQVKFTTTKGDVIIDVKREMAPNGADRFYNLVKEGFYTDVAFFRVLDRFMAQFGIHGDPRIAKLWRAAKIKDDKGGKASNTRGMVTFATAGPNTRTTQIFINYGNNASLDRQGFTPIGKVSKGMDVVDKLYKGYGEGAPSGRGPSQGRMQSQGNTYLKKDFAKLDYIKSATVVEKKK